MVVWSLMRGSPHHSYKILPDMVPVPRHCRLSRCRSKLFIPELLFLFGDHPHRVKKKGTGFTGNLPSRAVRHRARRSGRQAGPAPRRASRPVPVAARSARRRQSLLGAPAALLLLAAPASGTTKQDELDGALLAICAEAMRLDREADTADDGDAIDAMLDRWGELADVIAVTPARTPEGLQAKAGIIWRSMENMHRAWEAGDTEYQEVHDPLVWSLVNELTGRTPA